MKKNEIIQVFCEEIVNVIPADETFPYEPWDKYGDPSPIDGFVFALGDLFTPEGKYWEDLYTEEQGYEPYLKELQEIIDNFTKEDLTDIKFYLGAEKYYKLAKDILEYAYDRLEGGG